MRPIDGAVLGYGMVTSVMGEGGGRGAAESGNEHTLWFGMYFYIIILAAYVWSSSLPNNNYCKLKYHENRHLLIFSIILRVFLTILAP